MAISKYIAAAAMLVLAAAAASVTAQTQIPACASKLVPCANYMNSTKPPESCCGPLKEAVKSELPCLCSLFNSPALLQAFSINITQALQLPKNCGITSDSSICSKTSATPPTSSKTPPGPSAGETGKKGTSGAFGGASWIGMPVMVSLILFAWSILAF